MHLLVASLLKIESELGNALNRNGMLKKFQQADSLPGQLGLMAHHSSVSGMNAASSPAVSSFD